MSNHQRIPYIDLGAGIMILWMIIYHALFISWMCAMLNNWSCSDVTLLPEGIKAIINPEGRLEVVNPCVYFPYLSFFMPWFFYKSGHLFEKRECKNLLLKDSRKLLLTFVIWSAIGYVFFLIFGTLQHNITLHSATYSIVRGLFLSGQIPINAPLWFLLTLLGVRFMANIFIPERGEKYGWLKIVAIIVIGYSLAYICFRWNHRLLPYWVANGASGLVFFALGYCLREYESKWWMIMPCAIVYLICSFVGFPMVEMMGNKLLSGSYLLWIPTALSGIIIFNFLCKQLSEKVRIKWIESVGYNSMVIYVTHILIVYICTFIIEFFELTCCYPYMLWIYIISYVLFLPILCYVIPKHPNLIGNTNAINK